jgi:hypothetical protein
MNRSETISNLAKALTGFNAEVSKISKDASNPFFKNKYSTLDTIIDEIRPILQKNGLNIMQMPQSKDGEVALTTLLLHDSGEYIESPVLLMKAVKNDPQGIGSCITYARRYSLASFLSLNTGEDDDGNKATHNSNPVKSNKIDDIKIQSIKKLIADKGSEESKLLEYFKIKAFTEMTELQFTKAVELLNKK